MRFHPPKASLPAELRWLLEAAFTPRLPRFEGAAGEAAVLAGRFDLGPRIVARHGAGAIEERLGEAAGGMVRAHRRGVAVALAAERAADRLIALAGRSGLSILFLKGWALHRLAPGPTGWRPYIDLDLLLEPDAAEELRLLLLDDGWKGAAEAGNPQHLPPIISPQGTPVDLHYRLRGIRVGRSRWATAGELLAAGLCQPAGDEVGWLPSPPLMAAHIAVHALEQHGYRPATYPLLRAIGDLADLSAAVPEPDLAAAAADLAGASLSADETRALFDLARGLARGTVPDGSEAGDGGAATLLRHIVAGVLDPAYREGLAVDHTAGRLREARRDGQLMRYISRKLMGPAGAPSDAVSGGATGGAGSLRRRLLHPFHLCARFVAAAAARMRRAIDR